MKKKLVCISAAALAFLAATGMAKAMNIEVYINTNTWEVVSVQGDEPGAGLNVLDELASHQDSRGIWHYRYYNAGHFDNVVIEDYVTDAVITNLNLCNNIFYIDRSAKTAYQCTQGYYPCDGTGNGVNGEVKFGNSLENGDFVIGGRFTSCGNWDGSAYFYCYQWDNGWCGVVGKYISIPPDLNGNFWDWNTFYQLEVVLGPATLYGPTTSGGPNQAIQVLAGQAGYWNEWHDSFANGWWTVQNP
jgi:hypothetical protein